MTDEQWVEENAQQNENKEKTMSDENLIKLSTLVLDAGTQPRAELDEATVARYAEEMAAGAAFPPLVVFHDGQRHILADGFHRAAAALKAGLHALPADIRQGDVRDAILYAVGANATHGLPRSAEDIRRAVKRLLLDPEWSSWSNRKLAELAHTSHTTVGRVRNDLVKAGEIEPASERTYERDGEVKTMNVESIGTKQRLHLHRRFPGHRLVACGPDEDGEYIGRHKVYSGGTWKVRSRKLAVDRAVLVDWFEINERTLEAAEAATPSTGTLFQLEPDEMKPPLAGLSWHDDLLQASREAYRLHPDILACLGKTGIYNIALGRDAIRLTKALHVRGKFVPCAEDAKADWLWVIDAAQVEELVNDGHSLARLELDDQAANDLARAVMAGADMPWEVARREEAAAYARERKEKAPAILHIFDEAPTGTLHQVDGGGEDVSPAEPEAEEKPWPPIWLEQYEKAWRESKPREYILARVGGVLIAMRGMAMAIADDLGAKTGTITLHPPAGGIDPVASIKVWQGDLDKLPRLYGRYYTVIELDGASELKMLADQQLETLDAGALLAAKEAKKQSPTGTLHQVDETPNGDEPPDWVADEPPENAGKPGNGQRASVTPDTLLFHLETVKSGLALLTEQGDDIERAFYASLGRRIDRMSIEMTLKALKAVSSSATWKDIRFALANVDLTDTVLVDRELNPVLYGFREQVS